MAGCRRNDSQHVLAVMPVVKGMVIMSQDICVDVVAVQVLGKRRQVRRVVNGLARQLVSDKGLGELVASGMSLLRSGYHVFFPVFSGPAGPVPFIVLITKEEDGQDYQVQVRAFDNPADWRAESEKLLAVYPELPRE